VRISIVGVVIGVVVVVVVVFVVVTTLSFQLQKNAPSGLSGSPGLFFNFNLRGRKGTTVLSSVLSLPSALSPSPRNK
jgi:hypothetical protein